MSVDPEIRKRNMLIVKTMGILMAISFMILAVFMEKIGPLIGFSQSLYTSSFIKGIFFATGVLDLIVFSFVINK